LRDIPSTVLSSGLVIIEQAAGTNDATVASIVLSFLDASNVLLPQKPQQNDR
jgi:hypothetical protein